MDKKSGKILKNLEKSLQMIGFNGFEIQSNKDNEILVFNIKTSDPALLIGRGGDNLLALQHILNLMINRGISDYQKFIIDVNDYRAKQKNIAEEFARNAAKRVIEKQENELLAPMTSYQRKIVHTIVAEFDELTTEGVGEEPHRRVLIKIRSKE